MSKITDLLSLIDLNKLIAIFDIQVALAVILLSFLLKGVLARFILKVTYFITREEKKDVKKSKMYGTLRRMILISGLYAALRIIPTRAQVTYIANETFKLIVIIFITKVLTAFMTKDSKLFKKILNMSESDTVNDFFCKIFRGLTWIVAIFIIISELGWDLSGLVTGLGLASAVLALAAQELVRNLLSGFSILTDKPFEIGDWIEVGDNSGTVIDITFRSTKIKSIKNTIVTIPNSKITSEYVVNWNRLNSRRIDLLLSLDLNTSTEKIKKTIKEIKLVLKNNQHVIEDTVQVHFDEIGSCNNIKIFLYTTETDYYRFLNVKQEILCSLLTLVEKENIQLAYPTQKIYVKNTEGDTV